MTIDELKKQLKRYLPVTETFLTSVLLEETDITIESHQSIPADGIPHAMQKTDIFLFARDETRQSDVVLILDQEWYGLLSSIMLGVEEKSHNEITRDLLKKFSSELVVTLKKEMASNGLDLDLDEVQVVTHNQITKLFGHKEYFRVEMQVEGLADHPVRAEILIGDPASPRGLESANGAGRGKADYPNGDSRTGSGHSAARSRDEGEEGHSGHTGGPSSASETPRVEEAGETYSRQAGSSESEQVKKPDAAGSFSHVHAEEMGTIGYDEVISGRQIEFEEFEEGESVTSGGNSERLDLLKDVEMDVAVELGRIKLPLGKVLELVKGSVIELEKLAGEPVDILVNNQRIAHGEVVVVDEHFGVRITNLITTRQQLVQLK